MIRFLLSSFFFSFGFSSETMVGGQRDDNDCLIGAGFTWCDASQMCIRKWLTPCEDNYYDCNDCLLRQRKGENIACPVQCDTTTPTCENDEDCGDTGFCRQTTMDMDGPMECVLYSSEGDSCGGYTPPMYSSRCHPSLECANTMGPMIADAPGTCMNPCDPPNTRDAYGNCREIHESPIMVPELGPGPVLKGTHGCSSPCPPPTPCPSPGPDCEYTPSIPDDCGCTVGCGDIRCHPIDPPPHQFCSPVMCMMYCENGHQLDENGCELCSCNDLPPGSNNEEICPIPYDDCDGEYVCPKVTEITTCGTGGIQGYTTYQLSLIVKDPSLIKNLYAIFGEEVGSISHPLIIPGAYQVNNIFGSNIGGVSDSTFQFSQNSMYDSWLTIGITDGDSNNELGAIGIDFNEWRLNTPIESSDGAIFLMDPQLGNKNKNEIIIAQLTLPNDREDEAIINVQGKLNNLWADPWKQYNIVFHLSSPVRNDHQIPSNCEVWFDGCNTCQVRNGVLGGCTRMMCLREDNPSCLRLQSGH